MMADLNEPAEPIRAVRFKIISICTVAMFFACDCAAQPQLGFVAAGNQLQLNWPVDHTGWQLQSQPNSLAMRLGTNWVNMTGSAQTNLFLVPLDTTNGTVFFRLVRPY